MSTSSTTPHDTVPPCPAWCVQESGHNPEEVAEGRHVHRGPSFGDVTVYGNENLADGSIEFDAMVDADDFVVDRLRRLAADALTAADWIEAVR
ncbi:hypothetical protein [Nocardioides sp. zg-DK7169]|uniref:hypothetical protein n=1 Tax=Nocardioides sp. zg-DK7169 TaxID=2736600 RepID=UPI0015577CED|nr:hypothetical protein [Nocardioides sp. zg-DK7169]NPC96602.1 hypothetical protein [Nocardioides sp. zg-DK7169]